MLFQMSMSPLCQTLHWCNGVLSFKEANLTLA